MHIQQIRRAYPRKNITSLNLKDVALLAMTNILVTLSTPFAHGATSPSLPDQIRPNQVQVALQPTQPYVDFLKDQARKKGLSKSKMWLRIGHYKSTLFRGLTSEIDDPAFFLSHRGKSNPDDELMATLDAFAKPLNTSVDEKGVDTHAQCRYLSRRRYLNAELGIDPKQWPQHACPYNSNWKAQLAPIGVSLIFASAYLNNAASMFGHTFLKFHSSKNSSTQDLLNYGVSFAAHTGGDGGVAFAVRGLFGGYRGYYSLLPYHLTLKEYANLEGRDIFEYRIDLTPDQLDMLVDHLIEIQAAYMDYYFFDENCSYQLLTLLEVAKPELDVSNDFFYQVIPADSVRVLSRVPGLFSDIRYRASLETRFNAALKHINHQQTRLAKNLALAKPGDDFAGYSKELERLNSQTQVQVLDASLTFAGLLSEKNPDGWKQRNHELKVARAKTGITTEIEELTPPARPEQGHDSAIVGLQVGNFDRQNFAQFQFRPAYHHLLTRADGYLANTHLELGRLTLRHYLPTKQFQIQEFMINEIISASPANLFFQPMAWRAEIGWKHLEDKPSNSSIGPSLNGGVGYAIEPFHSDLLLAQAFLQAHADFNADLDARYRIGGSASLALISHLSKNLTARTGYEYRQYFIGEFQIVPKLFAEAHLQLSRNFEVRAKYTKSQQLEESVFGGFFHFLF